MPPTKPNPRNWNDVQTAIATAAIVTTLGMWNLFATPAKSEAVQVEQPAVPPTEIPAVDAAPTLMPQVKITFASQATTQPAAAQPQQKTRKKKDNGGGGGRTVTKTKSS